MDFVKVQGLENDFIVIDGTDRPDPKAVARWCNRRTGVGADGVLAIAPLGSGRVRMRYWNADGGEAEMCGNGLRCVARLAVERGWVKGPDLLINTAVGDLRATVNPDGSVRAVVGTPVQGRIERLEVAGVSVHPIAVGNPHAVRFTKDLDEVPVTELGPRIEKDPMFPDGTNVEFVTVVAPDAISMRIWERGVGETRGSGTGATAAAFAAHTFWEAEETVVVTLPGGEITIELTEDVAWMTGPAQIVYSGSLPATL